MRPITFSGFAPLCLFSALMVWAALIPTSASAQAGHIDGFVRFDAHLGVGWRGSVGPGVRLDIPLVRDGLISSVDDELALTLGGDVLFHTHGHRHYTYRDHRYRDHPYHTGDMTLLFPVAAQWNFILPRNWTVFPEIGLALEHHYKHLHPLFNIGGGARWHFNGGRAALLLRVTHPGGFQVGVTW
jgi:hypothetical protein